jgi:hypothetical protein
MLAFFSGAIVLQGMPPTLFPSTLLHKAFSPEKDRSEPQSKDPRIRLKPAPKIATWSINTGYRS